MNLEDFELPEFDFSLIGGFDNKLKNVLDGKHRNDEKCQNEEKSNIFEKHKTDENFKTEEKRKIDEKNYDSSLQKDTISKITQNSAILSNPQINFFKKSNPEIPTPHSNNLINDSTQQSIIDKINEYLDNDARGFDLLEKKLEELEMKLLNKI